MPHTTYALFKAIRTHQIKSPTVQGSARHGVPNACNLCHLDKSLAWTQEHLENRYALPRVRLSREQTQFSAALLWLLKGHAAQRAITAWHVGWEPARKASAEDWLAPFQAQLLDDPYGVVRYVAAEQLKRLPDFENFEYDFLSNSTDRRAARDRAMARWRPSPSNNPDMTLQEADGQIRKRLLARFLGQRDNRPVTIKE